MYLWEYYEPYFAVLVFVKQELRQEMGLKTLRMGIIMAPSIQFLALVEMAVGRSRA